MKNQFLSCILMTVGYAAQQEHQQSAHFLAEVDEDVFANSLAQTTSETAPVLAQTSAGYSHQSFANIQKIYNLGNKGRTFYIRWDYNEFLGKSGSRPEYANKKGILAWQFQAILEPTIAATRNYGALYNSELGYVTVTDCDGLGNIVYTHSPSGCQRQNMYWTYNGNHWYNAYGGYYLSWRSKWVWGEKRYYPKTSSSQPSHLMQATNSSQLGRTFLSFNDIKPSSIGSLPFTIPYTYGNKAYILNRTGNKCSKISGSYIITATPNSMEECEKFWIAKSITNQYHMIRSENIQYATVYSSDSYDIYHSITNNLQITRDIDNTLTDGWHLNGSILMNQNKQRWYLGGRVSLNTSGTDVIIVWLDEVKPTKGFWKKAAVMPNKDDPTAEKGEWTAQLKSGFVGSAPSSVYQDYIQGSMVPPTNVQESFSFSVEEGVHIEIETLPMASNTEAAAKSTMTNIKNVQEVSFEKKCNSELDHFTVYQYCISREAMTQIPAFEYCTEYSLCITGTEQEGTQDRLRLSTGETKLMWQALYDTSLFDQEITQ